MRGVPKLRCAVVLLVLVTASWSAAQPANGPLGRRKSPLYPGDGPEWTIFTPSIDTRIVYVSSAAGDDANSGLTSTAPKKTLAAAYALMRDGFPDWMLLRRGDTWYESFPFWAIGGRSNVEPMLIGSYGSGARPRLLTGTGNGFVANAYPTPLAHLALTDIFFLADRADGTSFEPGIVVSNGWSDVLIENCMVQDYPTNIVVEGAALRPSAIKIRRSIVVDAYSTTSNRSQGIFAGSTDGLVIEECVFDNNGWRRGVQGAGATLFNHNMYLHDSNSGVVTRGNISSRGSATGISQRNGGICEDNLLVQNPVGVFFGNSSGNASVLRQAIRNNVIIDARDINSGSRRGFGIWVGGAHDLEVYGNIVTHQRTGTGNATAYQFESAMRSVAVYRNITFDWTNYQSPDGIALALDLTHASGVIACDNTFQQVNGGFLTVYFPPTEGDDGPVFGRNRYFTSNPPPHQFYYGTVFQDWLNTTNEQWAVYGAQVFPDPTRSIDVYMTSLGLTPTVDAFLFRARLQERNSWDPRFTAAALNSYMQQGFGVGKRHCRADFNDDGSVNVLDLSAFQAAFSVGDSRADVNLDGVVNSLDTHLYQITFNAGCP